MIDCMQSNEFEKGSMCSSKINMIILYSSLLLKIKKYIKKIDKELI